MLLVALALVFMIVIGAGAAGEQKAKGKGKDIPFRQLISFRSTYNSEDQLADFTKLSFNKKVNVNLLHLGPKRDCFLTMGDDVSIYSSSPNQQPQSKMALANPYNSWQEFLQDTGGVQMIKSSSKFDFFIVTDNSINGVILTEFMADDPCGKVDTITTVFQASSDWNLVQAIISSSTSLWIASTTFGLQQIDIASGTVKTIPARDSAFTSLFYCVELNKLFAGSKTVLYTYFLDKNDAIIDEDHEWITGVIDSPPISITYDSINGCVWLAEADAVHKLDNQGRWWRYGYHQGSPLINITSVATDSDGFVWVGSDRGVACFRGSLSPKAVDTMTASDTARMNFDGESTVSTLSDFDSTDPWAWSYLRGNRWLPSDKVLDVVQAVRSQDHAVITLVATDMGLALLSAERWTLAEKALAFEQFQEPRHDRRNITGSVTLATYGLLSTYQKGVSDNDGLWTCLHGMGEAYSYAVTGSKSSYNKAWKAFYAIETLQLVAGGYPYFPARSYCYVPDGDLGCGNSDGEVRWQDSTTMPGYKWKNDTSSDEIDGHLAALPLYYDMIAHTDAEKKRVLALLEGITMGIIENDYYLIDPSTGKPTEWGFWNPKQINENPEHYSERAPNSLGLLAFFASCYSITRKEIYRDQFWMFVKDHKYAKNTMNVKIDNPEDDNHSDNELISLTFHSMFYAYSRIDGKKEPEFKAEMLEMVNTVRPAAERMFALIGAEYSPFWTSVFAGLMELPVDQVYIDNSLWTLRNWAIDGINWPVNLYDRNDIDTQSSQNRFDHLLSKQIRPVTERVTALWNTDPFEMQQGSGTSEFEPSVWRLPYFMMKYYNLV